jgi:DNA repair photolyase
MLRPAKGNMYDFGDNFFTWNPIKGKCCHDCSYCYVKRISHRFNVAQRPIHLDEKEMHVHLGNGNYIFVGSSCDLFAADVSDEWISRVFQRCRRFYKNYYLFQTKNPQRLTTQYFGLSAHSDRVCTTIETNRFMPEIMGNTPLPIHRALGLAQLADDGIKTMVTIEPIIDFDIEKMLHLIRVTKAFQVNIGADSGNNHLPEPPKEKVLALIAELEKFTKVYQKDNLRRLIK